MTFCFLLRHWAMAYWAITIFPACVYAETSTLVTLYSIDRNLLERTQFKLVLPIRFCGWLRYWSIVVTDLVLNSSAKVIDIKWNWWRVIQNYKAKYLSHVLLVALVTSSVSARWSERWTLGFPLKTERECGWQAAVLFSLFCGMLKNENRIR